MAEQTADQPRVGPLTFLQQVRAEGRKVTWATRKETTTATIMVFVMALIAAVFFLVVDFVLGSGINIILTSLTRIG